jgi:hypothetical protein
MQQGEQRRDLGFVAQDWNVYNVYCCYYFVCVTTVYVVYS